jgi:hypothetical protein
MNTIPPSFPQPATVEDYSSVTSSPISPAVLKNKKEGAKNVSSFDETHEASTGEDPILDVSSKLATKETIEDSMLNISGSEDTFNVSEVSRLPTKTSKSYGSNVASTSSANRQKGAETNEYYSLSYHSASTAPPTTSKKTSKKVYGTNSISPTSVDVIDENYSLSYLYAPTAGPSKGKKNLFLCGQVVLRALRHTLVASKVMLHPQLPHLKGKIILLHCSQVVIQALRHNLTLQVILFPQPFQQRAKQCLLLHIQVVLTLRYSLPLQAILPLHIMKT